MLKYMLKYICGNKWKSFSPSKSSLWENAMIFLHTDRKMPMNRWAEEIWIIYSKASLKPPPCYYPSYMDGCYALKLFSWLLNPTSKSPKPNPTQAALHFAPLFIFLDQSVFSSNDSLSTLLSLPIHNEVRSCGGGIPGS